LLLHICCAPDATVPFRDLKTENWDEITGFFYGSNIHPWKEYLLRADTLKFLSEHENIPVHIASWEPATWLARTSHLAKEPERGKRCALCFALQLRAAAGEGRSLGATHLGTTLTISPHKDVALISRLGEKIAASCGLLWQGRIWRKNDGFLRSLTISRELGLYRQHYCGCIYSMPKGE
jgi:predicted adenine nucleotide alpha hydrolase (AANH) superfamily ATPase